MKHVHLTNNMLFERKLVMVSFIVPIRLVHTTRNIFVL